MVTETSNEPVELTSEDREEIQNQIIQVRQSESLRHISEKPNGNAVTVPATPDTSSGNEALDEAIREQATPDKREEHRVKRKIRGIWKNWRTTALDAKSLEIEKIACQIAVERARTKAELNAIKRDEEIKKAEHWLALNKGNLEDIDANTTSRPSKFWYGLRRGFHHITKLTANVPKIIKNLFWIGALILGIVLLKVYNVL